MAITSPVPLVFSLIGDGSTTVLNTYLAPLLIQQGVPGTTVPQRLVSISASDNSEITGALDGQTLVTTFATAPADLTILRISVTLGI